MKLYNYNNLTKEKIKKLCARSAEDDNLVNSSVFAILNEVKINGDEALRTYSKKFDQVELGQLFLNKEQLKNIASSIDLTVKNAIDTAYQNIHKFHSTQLKSEEKIETMPGVTCWREARPIERVGLYIPGGTAVLPSTFLMLGIPAKIAGCREIIVCSPPQKDGLVNPALAYIASILQIEKIYLVGGAQAVAAMAFGTQTIPQVDKIFGPGNRYVTEAKKQVQHQVAIDMPAGPSEVLIVADDTANPAFIAADLLAQAEHGTDSQAILVATSNQIIDNVQIELDLQLKQLPRKAMAEQALANSYIIKVENLQDAIDFSNSYAPEHLILATEDFESLIPLIINAGSVFLGNLTPESAGDYASGTNHTLPTSGFAKAYSGVSTDSFIKKITFQELTLTGLKQIGSTVETLAEAEGLQAHKNAITLRRQQNGY